MRTRSGRRAWLTLVLLTALVGSSLVVQRVAEAADAPTVSAASPATGPKAGGTLLTITGTNFVAGATVTVQGVAAAGVTVVSATQITATTAGGTGGAALITVTNPDSQSGTLSGAFTYLENAPTVTLVTPNNGGSIGGTAVTITGTGFVGGATATFGGTPATSVTFVSATELTATTPAHTAGAVSVVVTNPDTQSGTLAGGYTYAAASPPTVTSVSPNSGTTGGGTPVTITGTNFVAGATVTFGGTAATNVAVVSATQLTAKTPAKSAGAVAVMVTNLDTQSGTLGGAFTYVATAKPKVTKVAPEVGALTGGTSVVITGTGFLAGAAVEFGGAAATGVVVNSSAQITATTPAKTTAGAVSVKVTNTDAQTDSLASAFTYLGPPTITGVTPATGSTAGGTEVTISGSNFGAGATVTFGGVAATGVTISSATKIVAKAPAHAAGKVTVAVKSAESQTGSKVDAFTYLAPPKVTSVSPLKGQATGGTTVTVTGTGFASGATVTFGTKAGTAVTVASGGTSLTVVTPAGTGSVDVTVTNSNGLSAKAALQFVYDAEAGTIIGGQAPGPGSIGLIVFSGGSNDQLTNAGVAGGCTSADALAFHTLIAGMWVSYLPAAPEVVNLRWSQEFAGGIPASTVMFVRCLG